LLWVLSLAVPLFSCGDRDTAVTAKRAFPQEKRIQAVKCPVGDVMDPSYMIQKGDYLLVRSGQPKKQLFVFTVPDLRFVCATGNQGRGPEEFSTFPTLVESRTDTFYVFGYAHRHLKSLAVDSAARVHLTECYEIPLHEVFNHMHLIDDSVLLYETVMLPQYAVYKYDLKNRKSIDELKIERETPESELTFDTSRGYMAANDSVMIYVYLYKNQIDIYDVKDFRLKRRIVGVYKPQKPAFRNKELYYLGVIPGDKYFYALFKGERTEKGENRSNTIEVYDYDGNPVALYRFDIPPLYFYPDEKNNCIYATHPSCMDTLLRYDL
ncbi:BF3164 family lipoprotein, partial [Alistipes sp.]